MKPIAYPPNKESPVFVLGDFKEPSHSDWTEAGFRDSYRIIYPDGMKDPGITCSPAYQVGDPQTHHDHIDFVYFKGKGLAVKEVKILGENEENADLVVSSYP